MSNSRKARQLAHQAEHALQYALSQLADPQIASATLLMVEPAPDASRLAVTIQAPPGASVENIEAGLREATGFLRGAIAEAITRKRAPTLVFHVLPPEVSR